MASGTRIGTSIRRARERRHWTQQQLASAAGVSLRTVNDWENDRSYPRNRVGALEEILGISLGSEPQPLSEEEREEAMQEYLRLGKILFPPAGPEQDTGVRGGHMHDEGRTA